MEGMVNADGRGPRVIPSRVGGPRLHREDPSPKANQMSERPC